MTNIKNLAKMAGVSVTTVSRVLNKHPYVSEEKKNAVLEAVKNSNYQQNINAVHLSKGKTQLIGVVLPFSDHPYFGLLLKGIANQALENNNKLVLFQTDYIESREMEAYSQYGPIVLCEQIKKGTKVSTIFVDHYKTFYDALEYLYRKGHEKIGYCIGRKKGTNSQYRDLAYRDFLEKYRLPYNEGYVMDSCLYFEDGEKVIKQIKEMETPPSALLVTSDQVAAGIVTCSQKQGIRIPNELAIIGFDNEPIANMMDITTIEIPLVEMGENLFRQAIEWDTLHKELFVKLIERGTVN